jgi:hypothetical protein
MRTTVRTAPAARSSSKTKRFGVRSSRMALFISESAASTIFLRQRVSTDSCSKMSDYILGRQRRSRQCYERLARVAVIHGMNKTSLSNPRIRFRLERAGMRSGTVPDRWCAGGDSPGELDHANLQRLKAIFKPRSRRGRSRREKRCERHNSSIPTARLRIKGNGSMFGVVAVTTSAQRAVRKLNLIRVRKRSIRQSHQNDPPHSQWHAGGVSTFFFGRPFGFLLPLPQIRMGMMT